VPRGRWLLGSLTGAALVAAGVVWLRARRGGSQPDVPEVLPLIEQHLTRAQWRAFLHKERNRRTVRERPAFLTWILDSAGEQDAAAVLTEMPPPARLVYRRILKPRYEAQHRWQMPSPTA